LILFEKKMDSEVVLEILLNNKSNQTFVFEKVLNLNSNNLSDWVDFIVIIHLLMYLSYL